MSLTIKRALINYNLDEAAATRSVARDHRLNARLMQRAYHETRICADDAHMMMHNERHETCAAVALPPFSAQRWASGAGVCSTTDIRTKLFLRQKCGF